MRLLEQKLKTKQIPTIKAATLKEGTRDKGQGTRDKGQGTRDKKLGRVNCGRFARKLTCAKAFAMT